MVKRVYSKGSPSVSLSGGKREAQRTTIIFTGKQLDAALAWIDGKTVGLCKDEWSIFHSDDTSESRVNIKYVLQLTVGYIWKMYVGYPVDLLAGISEMGSGL